MVLLRSVLNAFLPAGGIIERLGDKGKAQVKAKECLTILGGLAFQASPSSLANTSTHKAPHKNAETLLTVYERFLRDGGLGSKVFKVREQVRDITS